jgi:hypothetical protein
MQSKNCLNAKIGVTAAVALLLASAANASSSGSSQLSKRIEDRFKNSSEVSFYFVSRTENYKLSESELKKSATIRITRQCGNNCASFMAPVIDHLRNAAPARCQMGQEDILIVPSNGPSLMFSMSGRLLRYGPTCYFNKVGVGKILRTDSFFFR